MTRLLLINRVRDGCGIRMKERTTARVHFHIQWSQSDTYFNMLLLLLMSWWWWWLFVVAGQHIGRSMLFQFLIECQPRHAS
jgi:hypothetical protein